LRRLSKGIKNLQVLNLTSYTKFYYSPDISSDNSTNRLERLFFQPNPSTGTVSATIIGRVSALTPGPSPEHGRLFLVEKSAGEGSRMSKNRVSVEKHPLTLFFADSLKSV
jgi:hypothetical protein